jgi:hypothetical protein
MWFAVAIIGVIALGFGVTKLPGGNPPQTPPAAAAPANPAAPAPVEATPVPPPPAR